MERTLQLKNEGVSFLSLQQSAFTFYLRSNFWIDLPLCSRLLSFSDKLHWSVLIIRCAYSLFVEDIFPGGEDCPSALLQGVRLKGNEHWEGLCSLHKLTQLRNQTAQAVCERCNTTMDGETFSIRKGEHAKELKLLKLKSSFICMKNYTGTVAF